MPQTNQVVAVYNMIDFVLCHQSHKSLLQDGKSYAGTKLSSDHRLVIVHAKYQLCFAQNVTDLSLNGKPVQEQWQNITDAIHSAAESTIGTAHPTQHHKHQF